MPFVSYAQNREDVLLFRAFQDLKTGFYIDIGANHPKIDSVTQAFYDRGWSGINVEPIELNHIKLVGARTRDTNLNLAVADFSGEIDFYDVEGSGLSTTVASHAEMYASNKALVSKYPVICVTLEELCRKYAKEEIHFLKVDVEGAEERVIRGADWLNYRPWIVIVESTIPNTRTLAHHQWEPILLCNGYQLASFDGLNRFYVAYERQYLMDSFSSPVCSLDNYISYAEYKLLQSFHLMQLDIETHKSQIVELEQANKNMATILERLNSYLVVRVAKKYLKKFRAGKKRLEPITKSCKKFFKDKSAVFANFICKVSPNSYRRLLIIKKQWLKH